MKFTYQSYDVDGNDVVVELPGTRIVCDRCRGEGVHDHPAFSNGLTSEDFEDEDFREGYFSGRYDVVCECCKGANVITVPDEERCTPEQLEAYDKHINEERSYRAEIEAERRMGA